MLIKSNLITLILEKYIVVESNFILLMHDVFYVTSSISLIFQDCSNFVVKE